MYSLSGPKTFASGKFLSPILYLPSNPFSISIVFSCCVLGRYGPTPFASLGYILLNIPLATKTIIAPLAAEKPWFFQNSDLLNVAKNCLFTILLNSGSLKISDKGWSSKSSFKSISLKTCSEKDTVEKLTTFESTLSSVSLLMYFRKNPNPFLAIALWSFLIR